MRDIARIMIIYLKLKLQGPVSCHKFDFQLLYSQTTALRTPHFYGQLR